MYTRFAVYAERLPHQPVEGTVVAVGLMPEALRERPRIGSAFEHSNGDIAIYLDALPVTGRLLLVPEADQRAKPARRGPL